MFDEQWIVYRARDEIETEKFHKYMDAWRKQQEKQAGASENSDIAT